LIILDGQRALWIDESMGRWWTMLRHHSPHRTRAHHSRSQSQASRGLPEVTRNRSFIFTSTAAIARLNAIDEPLASSDEMIDIWICGECHVMEWKSPMVWLFEDQTDVNVR
jgi:hypothetical protein